jgi:hypothetical protein
VERTLPGNSPLPEKMGALFKVIVTGKGIEAHLHDLLFVHQARLSFFTLHKM